MAQFLTLEVEIPLPDQLSYRELRDVGEEYHVVVFRNGVPVERAIKSSYTRDSEDDEE